MPLLVAGETVVSPFTVKNLFHWVALMVETVVAVATSFLSLILASQHFLIFTILHIARHQVLDLAMAIIAMAQMVEI